MEIDDSSFRENERNKEDGGLRYSCGECKYFMWKMGRFGICLKTNKTVMETERCEYYYPKNK